MNKSGKPGVPFALLGDVFAPEPLGHAAVIIEDEKISRIVRSPRLSELPSDSREAGGRICPGFIDLQINGGFGVDVGPDPDGLAALASRLPETGTTGLPPVARTDLPYAAPASLILYSSNSAGLR